MFSIVVFEATSQLIHLPYMSHVSDSTESESNIFPKIIEPTGNNTKTRTRKI